MKTFNAVTSILFITVTFLTGDARSSLSTTLSLEIHDGIGTDSNIERSRTWKYSSDVGRVTRRGNYVFKRPDRPNRKIYTYLPKKYKPWTPTAVVMYFHGYCGSGKTFINDRKVKKMADKYNFALVSSTGLSGPGECNSWTFSGSSDGLGQNGDVTTCLEYFNRTNLCSSTCKCDNECGWTQCLDDDVQFVYDFVTGDDKYTNSLSDLVNFDQQKLFVMGDSNGGMFTWELAQNPLTAPLIRAIVPIVGTPHCDYDLPQAEGASVPVLLLTGENDDTVSPSNLPYPGNPTDTCIINRDGEDYIYISSHRITTTWAQGVEGCDVSDPNTFPKGEYHLPKRYQKKVVCRTWCTAAGQKAHSVDCNIVGSDHFAPHYVYDIGFQFFNSQLKRQVDLISLL